MKFLIRAAIVAMIVIDVAVVTAWFSYDPRKTSIPPPHRSTVAAAIVSLTVLAVRWADRRGR